MTIAISVFLISLLMLWYIYGGYFFILKILVFVKRKRKTKVDKKLSEDAVNKEEFTPGITVYFPAFNEEDNVHERIKNLLSQDYPEDQLEIIIVSDGSKDRTVQYAQEIIEANSSRNISLIEFKENRGRAEAQNIVAKAAKYDILLSTDAETRFSTNLLKEIIKPFADSRIGVVGGMIIFQPENSEIVKAYRQYRSMETAIQSYEAELGIGVHAGGACIAYRKNIWETIKYYEDIDQVISILARKKDYLTVQAENAVCYDKANTTRQQEIVARARTTRQALSSKLGRWGAREIFKYPMFTFALFSHRITRYFSPFYLLLLIISGFYLIIQSGYAIEFVVGLVCVALLMAFAHFFNILFIRKIFGRLSSFVYANIGFAIGVIQWIKGVKESNYTPTRTLIKD